MTGNLDRPGGSVFAEPAVDLDGTMRRSGLASYGAKRSRIGGFPDVLGQLPATLMAPDEMTPGVVALPHGWGHRGGWRRANAAGGVNVNELSSAAPESAERLAGMSKLNGIAVEVAADAAGEEIEQGTARAVAGP